MESDNLQNFELLCFLKSSLLDLLQASVSQRECGQIRNVSEDSGVENGNLNIGTGHHNFKHEQILLKMKQPLYDVRSIVGMFAKIYTKRSEEK